MKYLLLLIVAVLGPLIYWVLGSAFEKNQRGKPFPPVPGAEFKVGVDPWKQILLDRPIADAPLAGRDPWLVRISGTADVKDPRDRYNADLLRLVLEKTVPTYGPFQLVAGEAYNRLRAFLEVQDGRLDVTWSVSSSLREQVLLPVRREMIRGLHGYRIFLIRKDDQERFSRVRTLDDLRQLRGGGGHDWQATEVWRVNNLPIITSDTYLTLFQMLQHGRFDYFSRALFEPEMELQTHPDNGLALEQELIIQFPAPCYFFVHPSRRDLAARLEKGMDLAMKDGSLVSLFNKMIALSSEVHLSNRRFIHLKNPLSAPPDEAPDHRFTFSPEDLVRRYP